jgi:hypothetical protein
MFCIGENVLYPHHVQCYTWSGTHYRSTENGRLWSMLPYGSVHHLLAHRYSFQRPHIMVTIRDSQAQMVHYRKITATIQVQNGTEQANLLI